MLHLGRFAFFPIPNCVQTVQYFLPKNIYIYIKFIKQQQFKVNPFCVGFATSHFQVDKENEILQSTTERKLVIIDNLHDFLFVSAKLGL